MKVVFVTPLVCPLKFSFTDYNSIPFFFPKQFYINYVLRISCWLFLLVLMITAFLCLITAGIYISNNFQNSIKKTPTRDSKECINE